MFLSLGVELRGLSPEDTSSASKGFHGKLDLLHLTSGLYTSEGYSKGFGLSGCPLGKSQSLAMHQLAASLMPDPLVPLWVSSVPHWGIYPGNPDHGERGLSLGSLPGADGEYPHVHSSFLEGGKEPLLALLPPGSLGEVSRSTGNGWLGSHGGVVGSSFWDGGLGGCPQGALVPSAFTCSVFSSGVGMV